MTNLRISHILPLCLLFTLVIIPFMVSAATVELAWDANNEEDLAGYKIYYGYASRDYHTSIDVGNVTTYQITGLEDDQTYYFAVTAYNTSGLESGYSDEISYVPLENDTVTYNPSMEDIENFPGYWWTYGNDLDRKSGWIEGVAHSGNHSIKIENTTGTDAGWYGEMITFSEPYPHTLILGGWAKAEDVVPDGIFAIDFYIQFEDGSELWYYYDLQFSPGTHDWENVESTITFDKGVKQIRPYCLLYRTTGTAWFDDVYAIAPSIRDDTVTYNPSMEDRENAPQYWWTYGNDLDRQSGWIEGVAHSGHHSIKIENTTGTNAGWYGEMITFSEPYPHTLILGGWAKAEDVVPDGIFAIDFYIQFEDGSELWYYYDLQFSAGTHDWENVESIVSFDKGIKEIRPYCLLYGTTGTVWFDDVYAVIQ